MFRKITIVTALYLFTIQELNKLVVIITAENMSCIHIKQKMLGKNEKSVYTFHIRWNELVKFQGQLKRLFK